MSAVLAIWSSGASPRPISHRPATASTMSSTAPVTSSTSSRPRISLPTALLGRAITSTLGFGGRVPLLCDASLALTSRQMAVRGGWPGREMLNSWPMGLARRKARKDPEPATLFSTCSTSEVAADGPDSVTTWRVTVS